MLSIKYSLIIAVVLSLGFSSSNADLPAPPGTVKITNTFFADATERTNLDWQEYLYWLKANQSEQYEANYPDTTVWRQIPMGYFEPFVKSYFSHPAYNDYPVVGISHQQAKDYCAWRTDRVKETMALNGTFEKHPQLKNLKYRLPTLTEWHLLVRLNRPGYAEKLKKKNEHKLRFNFKRGRTRPPTGSIGEFYVTAPVYSYLGGTNGMYHLYGNVAEMISEYGQAQGGSFLHTEYEVRSGNSFPYERPEPWLGFRCVCEIE